ncbi:MAG: DUF2442 domain-containing protein [Betaproteobacteria bacterium]|nr:DUF2442 domain-containing protein [Betaproteobacteria bacterium]
MIKLLDVKTIAPHQLELTFSDHSLGVFDGANYLASRQGPLLENLRDPAYFARCFIDAGALCWPNGLELSASRLHELAGNTVTTI